MTMTYSFSLAEMQTAYEDWGCNCGPTALAFALQTNLDTVRPAIPDFEARRYTSPTMMRQALANLGATVDVIRKPQVADMFDLSPALVRVLWSGPWNGQKWAARNSHWIATYRQSGERIVFDCNSGLTTFEVWEGNTVPAILSTVKRSDGDWIIGNVWRFPPLPSNGKGVGNV